MLPLTPCHNYVNRPSECEIKPAPSITRMNTDDLGLTEPLSAKAPDMVHRPSHYTFSVIEPITIIEAWGLNFHLGSAIKYFARAGKKDKTKEIEDFEKAKWYLDRHIENLKKEQNEAKTTQSKK